MPIDFIPVLGVKVRNEPELERATVGQPRAFLSVGENPTYGEGAAAVGRILSGLYDDQYVEGGDHSEWPVAPERIAGATSRAFENIYGEPPPFDFWVSAWPTQVSEADAPVLRHLDGDPSRANEPVVGALRAARAVTSTGYRGEYVRAILDHDALVRARQAFDQLSSDDKLTFILALAFESFQPGRRIDSPSELIGFFLGSKTPTSRGELSVPSTVRPRSMPANESLRLNERSVFSLTDAFVVAARRAALNSCYPAEGLPRYRRVDITALKALSELAEDPFPMWELLPDAVPHPPHAASDLRSFVMGGGETDRFRPE